MFLLSAEPFPDCAGPVQLSFCFQAPKPVRQKRRQLTPEERRKCATSRRCLKCGGLHRSRWPGLCDKCKRHVDYKAGDGYDDYTVAV